MPYSPVCLALAIPRPLLKAATGVAVKAWAMLATWVVTLAMLAGCDAASFESPPDGAALACDPRLVSEWYTGEWASYGAQEPRPKHADTEFLRIEARGCEPISRKTGKRPGDLRDYTLSYLPDAAGAEDGLWMKVKLA